MIVWHNIGHHFTLITSPGAEVHTAYIKTSSDNLKYLIEIQLALQS